MMNNLFESITFSIITIALFANFVSVLTGAAALLGVLRGYIAIKRDFDKHYKGDIWQYITGLLKKNR